MKKSKSEIAIVAAGLSYVPVGLSLMVLWALGRFELVDVTVEVAIEVFMVERCATFLAVWLYLRRVLGKATSPST